VSLNHFAAAPRTARGDPIVEGDRRVCEFVDALTTSGAGLYLGGVDAALLSRPVLRTTNAALGLDPPEAQRRLDRPPGVYSRPRRSDAVQ
jgi:hypothetical protein